MVESGARSHRADPQILHLPLLGTAAWRFRYQGKYSRANLTPLSSIAD
jgi:hypothetical protein